MPDILARIVSVKRTALPGLRQRGAALERLAADRVGKQRDFASALRASPPAVIAEVKKASPSRGLLSHDFNPARTARQYEAGGAAALSVLTDEEFFQGGLADLESARDSCVLPVLRKDFTIDPLQIVEAAAHGADAILLIAAILDAAQMRDLRELAESLGLAALVEVHTADELAATVDSGARIIGVNNRDLHTFEVRLSLSLDLAASIPKEVTRVAESGIFTHDDVRQLSGAGYHAFLVGEALMKSADPAAALRVLRG
ncbi:MAG: indole-3-glycerol phosphate synthase TrpC [Bryobacteraceae bacterium]|nr:indole-3-glycerol phosphate synthase TrpC [Bryobacteraceae bacterium]